MASVCPPAPRLRPQSTPLDLDFIEPFELPPPALETSEGFDLERAELFADQTDAHFEFSKRRGTQRPNDGGAEGGDEEKDKIGDASGEGEKDLAEHVVELPAKWPRRSPAPDPHFSVPELWLPEAALSDAPVSHYHEPASCGSVNIASLADHRYISLDSLKLRSDSTSPAGEMRSTCSSRSSTCSTRASTPGTADRSCFQKNRSFSDLLKRMDDRVQIGKVFQLAEESELLALQKAPEEL
eukprot:TRINITY_DN60862_c0_g1_i1.p1 TRINITY_DN60862_c0_g1~~TRINITY_DN60862_c0_g1_i1.p1  ORF type:complete len:240 (-),score=49.03 TRINITY_DN60862_c0_g1_i1:62-781(-)